MSRTHDARTGAPSVRLGVGLTTLAVGYPLLELLATAPEFFVAQDLTRAGVLTLALLVVLVPALLVATLLGAMKPWPRLRHGVAGTVFAALGALIVLAVARPAEGVPAGVVIAAASVMGAAFGWGLLRATVPSWVGTVAVLVTIAVPVWFGLQPAVQTLSRAHDLDPGATATVARPAPVVMVVFDELALSALLDPSLRINARRFPHLAALAARSTWYRRTAAAAETTGKALPALLSGQWPRHQTPPTAGAYPHNLFTGLAGSHRAWAFEPMSRLCPDDLNHATRPTVSTTDQARRIAVDLGVVYLHRILPAAWTERLPPISQGWRDFSHRQTPTPSASPAASAAPFDLFHEAVEALRDDRRATLERFLDGIDRAPQPAVHLLHVLLPHAPSNLTAEGHHYDADPREPGRRDQIWQPMPFWIAQAYQRYIVQTQFVDAFVGRLTARLEAHDLFDEALIVITADHGVAFRAGHHRRLLAPETAADIVPIPLFIKAPGQRQGAVVDRALSAIDIVPTVFDLLGVELPADWVLDGRSARDPEHDRAVLPILTEDGTVTELAPTVFDGLTEMARYQHDHFGTGDDPLDLYRYGPHSELVGQRVEALRTGAADPWQWAHRHADRYAAIDLAGPTLPALLDATVFVPRGGRRDGDLAISLNGVIAATMPLPLVDRVNRRISIMLPSRLFVSGTNTVAIHRIREARHGVVLHPLPHAGPRDNVPL